MKISVLVLCKNEAANIATCLDGVFAQETPGKVEVIVVDSGSTDATIDVALRYPVRLERIPPETFHHARTRNYAARLATGEVLVYLAADAFPATKTWLNALVEDFDDPLVGAAYGRHLPKLDSTCERTDALNMLYGEAKIIKDASSKARLGYRYYLMSTVNAAIRRNVWAATTFPEDVKVFEDIAIAKRILDDGWKIIYEPNAPVYHSHVHSTIGLFKRYFDLGYTLNRLGIWAEGTRGSLMRDGLSLVRRKIVRPQNNGKPKKTTSSLKQELAKSAGMFLGLNERFIPLLVKRQISAFKVYD
jgi:rhamnosyltransferase